MNTGRDTTSRETMEEGPSTERNDLRELVRDALRELLPKLFGERGGGDGNMDDSSRRPGKIQPGGRRGLRVAWVVQRNWGWTVQRPHSMFGDKIQESGL